MAQKAAISSLTNMTGMDKSSATKLLRQHDWNANAAANAHFGGGANTANNPHKATATKLFDKYREDPKESPDEISTEGMMQMLQDADIDIEGLGALVFGELVGAPILGTLHKQPFVDGLTAANVSDLPSIHKVVEQRVNNLTNPAERAQFKAIYKHTFILARPEGQKAVPLEMATIFWRLLFSEPSVEWSTTSTPWLEWWIEFLESRWKKSVNKDMWDQTFSFAQRTLDDESLSWWSEDSAWPGVIDEFVEYVVKEKREGEAMDTA